MTCDQVEGRRMCIIMQNSDGGERETDVYHRDKCNGRIPGAYQVSVAEIRLRREPLFSEYDTQLIYFY